MFFECSELFWLRGGVKKTLFKHLNVKFNYFNFFTSFLTTPDHLKPYCCRQPSVQIFKVNMQVNPTALVLQIFRMNENKIVERCSLFTFFKTNLSSQHKENNFRSIPVDSSRSASHRHTKFLFFIMLPGYFCRLLACCHALHIWSYILGINIRLW